jgi:hypothetical protein
MLGTDPLQKGWAYSVIFRARIGAIGGKKGGRKLANLI